MYRLIVVFIMRKSLFERPVFRNGSIVGSQMKNEIRHQRFYLDDWTLFHVNKRSVTLRNNTTNEIFLIGARTFNELQKHDQFIKYVKVPNPKVVGQELNWIKIDR